MRRANDEEGKRVKKMKQILTAACCLVLLLAMVPAAAEDGFSTSYTYTYDYWEDVQESPDAYRVETIIDMTTLGLEKMEGIPMRNPQSLFVQGEYIYIVDTGNNRILEIHREGKTYVLTRVIKEMTGWAGDASEIPSDIELPPEDVEEASEEDTAEADEAATEAETGAETGGEEPAGETVAVSSDMDTFAMPYDVAVDPQGNIYVADYGHERIAMMDKDLHWIRDYIKPTDATFDQKLSFRPKKIVIDVAGRVYALCEKVNKGIVKYEADGTFSGFIGANPVNVSMAEYIWKRYFQSKEQRAQTSSDVSTEYENIYIDEDGFIYATNTVFSEYDLKSDAAKPIRRINSLGGDILIKNDKFPPIGDLWWIEGSDNDNSREKLGTSKFADITVLANDIYVALDRSRGRLFGYDSQGIILWAFGATGNTDGAFTGAVSIEHMGYDLLVLDRLKCSITVFTPTEYGQAIYDATEKYLDGEYDESAELWQEVLKMNANFPLAFRGIGRAIMRQNRYEEAMDYFKLAHDRENYGRAFKLYRKEWVEKNIWWIVLIIALLLIVPLALGRVRRMKWEVSEHERSKVRK